MNHLGLLYASKEASKKAKRLAYLLLPKNSQEQETDMGKQIAIVQNTAKRKNGISPQGYIDYGDWEKIYLWLLEKITKAEQKEIKDPKNIGWTRTQEKKGRSFLFAPVVNN